MKTEIHPEYAETAVTCSCGNTFVTRSTKPGAMHVELCNECHPFFTGRQKLVDTGGRVERFQKRYAGTEVKSKKRQRAETAPAEAATVETAPSDIEPADTEPADTAPVDTAPVDTAPVEAAATAE